MVAEGPGAQCMGYILGKAEGVGPGWHGHVTAVTVAPEFRSALTNPTHTPCRVAASGVVDETLTDGILLFVLHFVRKAFFL